MNILRRKHCVKAIAGVPRGPSNESDSSTGAMVLLVGVSRSGRSCRAKSDPIRLDEPAEVYVVYLVSPTGLKVFCNAPDSWALSFEGFVEGA